MGSHERPTGSLDHPVDPLPDLEFWPQLEFDLMHGIDWLDNPSMGLHQHPHAANAPPHAADKPSTHQMGLNQPMMATTLGNGGSEPHLDTAEATTVPQQPPAQADASGFTVAVDTVSLGLTNILF